MLSINFSTMDLCTRIELSTHKHINKSYISIQHTHILYSLSPFSLRRMNAMHD